MIQAAVVVGVSAGGAGAGQLFNYALFFSLL
jgi:energy-converting hydrogenase Eha subunit H